MSDGGGDDACTEDESVTPDVDARPAGEGKLVDQFLTSLSSHRRRAVLHRLRENGVADVDELAEHVASTSNDVPKTELGDEQVERAKATLVHSDLPHLRDVGIIEYDRRNETVRYRQSSQFVTRILRTCEELEMVPASTE